MSAPAFGWWGPWHLAADTKYLRRYSGNIDWQFGGGLRVAPRYHWTVTLSFGPVTLSVALTRWWDGIPDSSRPNAPWRDLCPRDRTPMHETRFTSFPPGDKFLYCRSCNTDWRKNG